MIDLLSNTKSTAFIESAFRLLEIQSIRNLRYPKKQVKIISIQADFNESIYSIYAELPLTVVPNQDTENPSLEIEQIYPEETLEEYGQEDNLGQLLAVTAFQLEIEEQVIEDGEYIDNPDYYFANDYFSIPLENFDQSSYDANIDWNVDFIEASFAPIVILPNNSTELNNNNLVLDEIPTDNNFYTKNPKNISNQIDIEEMKVFISATIPFVASIDIQGNTKINPIDYA